MRILLLTQWFDPEPTFKGLSFAKALHDRGHQVEVLTGFPNYPGGRLYSGYRIRLLSRENVDGISVVRVPLVPSHSRSVIGRIANYLSFAVAASLLGPWVTGPADVIYVYHPPATVAFPAVVLGLLKRAPFAYDVQDMWPDSLEATGMVRHSSLLGAVDVWCRAAYAAAAKVIVESPGFVSLLLQRGVRADKIAFIPNWCDEEKIGSFDGADQDFRKYRERRHPFTVVFSGNMGKAQALDAVLDAAAILASRSPQVQFVFVGDGVEAGRLASSAAERALPNVVFLPRLPLSKIGRVLSQATVLLVHLRDQPLFRRTIPSKIQAYLFMGKPILAAVRGDAADVVERAGAGVTCIPESPESIADAVDFLSRSSHEELAEMGRRGREYYDRELSVASGVARFEQVFNEIRR